ncbi:MAG: hypothetical protein SFY80_15810 [Verrucomicrobiota bacterium]|nr:hypothetical protein [Verrucomicrobiota bacterium]
MKTITLIPTPAMMAIIFALAVANKFGIAEGFRPFGILLLILLPLLVLFELIFFGYDILKRKDPIISRSFDPRLITHAVGMVIATWIIVAIISFPALHLG